MEDHSLPKPRDPHLADLLIERFIAGECTLTERVAIERWITANPARGNALLALRANGDTEYESLDPSIDLNVAEYRLFRRLGIILPIGFPATKRGTSRIGTRKVPSVPPQQSGSAEIPVETPKGRSKAWNLVGVIASVIVAVFSIWTLRQHTRDDLHAPTLTYTTASGERAIVHLADGSRVVLAPRTALYLTKDFGQQTRHVTLTGEAFFEIRSRSTAPFIVQTGDVLTRVLGTSFNVRRYESDTETHVAVTDGRVSVETTPAEGTRDPGASASARLGTRNPAIVLAAGMVGTISDSIAIGKRVDDVTRYTRWIDGKLTFRDTPIPQVLTTLGYWYGVEFRLIDTSLARHDLSDTFDYGSTTDMLNTLKVLLDVKMTVEGKVVTLHPRHAITRPAPGRRELPKLLNPQPDREVGR